MKVTIINLPKRFAHGNQNVFNNPIVSIDPSHKYAVVEILRNELFIAIKIISYDDIFIDGEYVDSFEYTDNDIPALIKFRVEWNFIHFGFCKLILWTPELVDGFEKTAKRFYFDRELYLKTYEKINGIPCGKSSSAHNE